MSHCVHSPSKHTSLARLEQIRRDNYQGVGKEYSEGEVDELIARKYDRMIDKFDPLDFDAVEQEVEKRRVEIVVMPPLPAPPTGEVRVVYLPAPPSEWERVCKAFIRFRDEYEALHL